MKRYLSIFIIIALAGGIGYFTSCDEDGGLNIFTLEQDREFGRNFDQKIQDNPKYHILEKNNHSEAYDHLNRIKNSLLQSDYLNHRDDFDWKARIIKNDTTLNAFAVPGGYMYFYTGLIKYLDNEAQFAGVVAHEMAHVDKRHSTKLMTKEYTFQLLLGLITGKNPEKWAQILADLTINLGKLQFSKKNENEADEFAVKYTSDTELYPKGVAGFFIKLEDQNSGSYIPEFLRTHPSPDNRIENIDEVWKSLGSPTGDKKQGRYQEFKNALP
jgi:predicted Zn-dependent protease